MKILNYTMLFVCMLYYIFKSTTNAQLLPYIVSISCCLTIPSISHLYRVLVYHKLRTGCCHAAVVQQRTRFRLPVFLSHIPNVRLSAVYPPSILPAPFRSTLLPTLSHTASASKDRNPLQASSQPA